MAKRWLQSVDVETDAQGKPTFEAALEALAALIADGRLKVSLSAPIQADMIDVDVEAIVNAAHSVRDRLPEAGAASAAKQDTGNTALALLTGSGLTRVEKNDVTVAGVAKPIVAAGASVQVRLHALTVVFQAANDANTWQVEDSDGAVLMGPFKAPALGSGLDRGMPVNKLSVMTMPAAGKGLSIKSATSACRFHAVYSTEAVS